MADNTNMTTEQTAFEGASKAYYRSVHFWGQLTLGLGMAFSCIGAVYLGFIKGYFPGWTPMLWDMSSLTSHHSSPTPF